MDINQIVNSQVRPWSFNVFLCFTTFLIVLLIILLIGYIFDKISFGRILAIILLYTYSFSVLSSTLFTRKYGVTRYELTLFWSYFKIIKEQNTGLLIQVLLNCIMLFPVGFLLPFSISKYMSWRSCLFISASFSTCIELSQLIFKLGLFEFDDIVHNVIGAMLGFGLAKLIIYLMDNED